MDNKKLAQLLFPDIDKTPEYYEELYPARELPIEGVNSEMILDKVTIKDKMLVQKSELMDIIKSKKIDCLVTFGAGDIDHFVVPIENYLKECLKKY